MNKQQEIETEYDEDKIKQYLLKRKWFSEYLKEKYKDKVETVETAYGIIEVRRIKTWQETTIL